MHKYGPLWQQRELDRVLAHLRPTFDILNSLPPSHLENLKQMEALSSRFSLPPKFLSTSDEILKMIDTSDLYKSFPALANIGQDMFGAYDSIQRQMISLSTVSRTMESDLEFVSKTIAESFVGSEAIVRMAGSDLQNISALTRASKSFEQFTASQIDFESDVTDVFKSNTISALAASASLLPNMSYLSELGVLMDTAKVSAIVGLPPINVFDELGLYISGFDLGDPNINVDEIVEESPSQSIVDLGGRLVKLIYDLNIEAERSGSEPLFKPTTKTMYAFHVIPTTVAPQEDSFLEIVDSLYFLLYEGSGSAKRLTDRVAVDRLEALWLLKHLRLGARHDVDHGSANDAQKKSEQVGAAYCELVGRRSLKTREEFLQAQRALYQRLIDMLESIWFG